MEDILIHLLNISITASFLVLAIFVYRLFAKTAPKWVSVLLWGLVGLRLVFSFSIESAMSLIPSETTVPPTITHDRYPALDTGFGTLDEIVNPILSGSMEARPEYSANPMHVWITVIGWIWLAVMICMLVYMSASFIYLRIKTRVKVEREGNVYLCDYVKTPFILGIIRPHVYLPSDISDKDYSHVVAHERAHIKRLDYVWKPLGFLLLSVYWFNPLLWVAYVLLCRDIESACDEKVISALSDNEKADYSEVLLSLGIKSRVISACPLAFGEVSVKSRVSAIARYKKPATIAIVISLVVCIIFAACFLTYKKKESIGIEPGVWCAQKLIASTEASPLCEDVPRFVFTEGADILVESSDLSDILYKRLGLKHTAYISKNEYTEMLDGLAFREGYGAEYFHDTVKTVYRIEPSVSSGIEYEEVYLLITENELYMGYYDDEKITSLYELRLNEILPTYVYTATYTSPGTNGASITLDTKTHKGSIMFSLWSSYIATGSYVYENSKVIFTTDDSFGLKFVFLDVGNALIFSAKDSELKDFGRPFEDGESFGSFYQLYGAASDTAWFDINGDGKQELISANIEKNGTLWYLVHSQGQTLSNKTLPFEKYDDIRLEVIGDSLYLVCEYSDKNFNHYRYLVTYDGEDLILTPEE